LFESCSPKNLPLRNLYVDSTSKKVSEVQLKIVSGRSEGERLSLEKCRLDAHAATIRLTDETLAVLQQQCFEAHAMTDGGGEGYIQRSEEGTMNVCRNTRTSSNTFQSGLTEINLLQLRGRAREKFVQAFGCQFETRFQIEFNQNDAISKLRYSPTNKQHRSRQHKRLLLSQRLIHILYG
jgi:hypothetical protein